MDSNQEALLGRIAEQAEVLARLRAEADAQRDVLVGLVRDAGGLGVRQVDIVKASRWTREYVHRITSGKLLPSGEQAV